jgi:cellulose synthase/poly-beta-1,6-N-acetylglucosamine synthase-like glycosyltransferase
LAYALYHTFISLVGTLKRPAKVIPPSDIINKFAVLIPARNEAAVIPRLLKSLKAQDYPEEALDIYVLPNNCTDDTRGAALRAGAKVLDIEAEVHSKGEVLHYAFEALLKAELYDAYLIFDADNFVDAGFVKAANDALNAGYAVGQGYRDSSNADDHWIAGNSSEFFWFMNRLYNQARFSLNISASLNGTGIMIGADAIGRVGWNVNSLTEDLEFTALCALERIKICYMRNAVLYDEQPTNMRDSIIQRRRWTAGTLQCFRRYFGKLMRCMIRYRSISALDIALTFAGPIIQFISAVPVVLSVIMIVLEVLRSPILTAWTAVQLIGSSLIGAILGSMAFVVLICALEKKLTAIRLRDILTMPLFLTSWMFINFYCLCTRPPKWVQIKHGDPPAGTPLNKPAWLLKRGRRGVGV